MFTLGSLCSGYGGLDLAAEAVLGTDMQWCAENDPAASLVLDKRFHVPNLGDVNAIDWASVPSVDVLTAGYPCQPFSIAGRKKGMHDNRHVWPSVVQAIRHLRPGIVILENVANHVRIGLSDVLADLAENGFDAAWGVYSASEAQAAHRRARLFIVATDPDSQSVQQWRRTASSQTESGESWSVAGRCSSLFPDSKSFRHSWLRQAWDWGNGSENGCDSTGVDFQEYGPAVHRWERCVGRSAPYPKVVGPRGGMKVNPAFIEWLMGLPQGWVTDVAGVELNPAIRLLGQGVVPQQAELALRQLVPLVMTPDNPSGTDSIKNPSRVRVGLNP